MPTGRVRRRPARADLHLLPPRPSARAPGGPDPAHALGPQHRRDRAGVPGQRADDVAAAGASEAEDPRGRASPSGCRRLRRCRPGWPPCSGVLYLVFNQGYSGSASLRRRGARARPRPRPADARRARGHGSAGVDAAARGTQPGSSRRAGRADPAGGAATAPTGSADLIAEGVRMLDAGVARCGVAGPYQVQAAIAACHATAASFEATDWHEIASLYELLAAMTPSPVVELNRAVAVAMADGPMAGLELLEPLDQTLSGFYLLPATRADLLRRSVPASRRPGSPTGTRWSWRPARPSVATSSAGWQRFPDPGCRSSRFPVRRWPTRTSSIGGTGMLLADKAVLVTGANRGIGQALVEEALRRGAKRVYAGTRQPLAALGSTGHAADAGRDRASSRSRAAVERVESLDILVNNAGVGALRRPRRPCRARAAPRRQPLRHLRRDAGLPAVADPVSRGAIVNVAVAGGRRRRAGACRPTRCRRRRRSRCRSRCARSSPAGRERARRPDRPGGHGHVARPRRPEGLARVGGAGHPRRRRARARRTSSPIPCRRPWRASWRSSAPRTLEARTRHSSKPSPSRREQHDRHAAGGPGPWRADGDARARRRLLGRRDPADARRDGHGRRAPRSGRSRPSSPCGCR